MDANSRINELKIKIMMSLEPSYYLILYELNLALDQ